jgi:acid-sensing ion channel, other
MRRLKPVKSVKEHISLLKTSVKHQTREFFDNSTLHGIRYIAEEERSFSEKFMWFSFVSIGAVAAFVIIGSLWEKFQTNPTITGE